MNFFKGFIDGITNAFKAFGVIFDKGIWPFIFAPILVWLAMWLGSIWLFASLAEQFSNYLKELINAESIPNEGSWLSFIKPFLTGYFHFFISIIFKVLFWFVSGTFTKYITLILLSPILSYISEITEEKLYPQNQYPFSWSLFIKNIFRGIAISIRSMCFEFGIMIVTFAVSLIFPPLVIITTPFLAFVSWYFIGFTMLDYNFERHNMSLKDSVEFARKNMGIACGIGFIYALIMWLPLFAGIMFAPIVAVVGSTTAFLQLKNSTSQAK
jgi:CysZ protein